MRPGTLNPHPGMRSESSLYALRQVDNRRLLGLRNGLEPLSPGPKPGVLPITPPESGEQRLCRCLARLVLRLQSGSGDTGHGDARHCSERLAGESGSRSVMRVHHSNRTTQRIGIMKRLPKRRCGRPRAYGESSEGDSASGDGISRCAISGVFGGNPSGKSATNASFTNGGAPRM